MSDCGCDKAKADLEEYLRHELAHSEHADIAEHIAGCASCSEEAHVGVVLTAAVRRACQDTAPEALREQVITHLRLLTRH